MSREIYRPNGQKNNNSIPPFRSGTIKGSRNTISADTIQEARDLFYGNNIDWTDAETIVMKELNNHCSEKSRRLNTHQDICNYLHNLYATKNNDYGNSVSDTFQKFRNRRILGKNV